MKLISVLLWMIHTNKGKAEQKKQNYAKKEQKFLALTNYLVLNQTSYKSCLQIKMFSLGSVEKSRMVIQHFSLKGNLLLFLFCIFF